MSASATGPVPESGSPDEPTAELPAVTGGPGSLAEENGTRRYSDRYLRGAGQGSLSTALAAAGQVRAHPLETVAVLVLGIGGLAFPPAWLLGAGLALASKFWDLRDKWIGVAGPVLLVIAGTAVAMVIGGKRGSFGAYAFEVWLSVGRISRAAAVLGAVYLIWRLRRGPRPPKLPPWNQPHRFG